MPTGGRLHGCFCNRLIIKPFFLPMPYLRLTFALPTPYLRRFILGFR